MNVSQLAVGAGLILAAAMIAGYIYRNVPRHAPARYFRRGRRIPLIHKTKSNCLWIRPNTK